jgi:hypothetical protein
LLSIVAEEEISLFFEAWSAIGVGMVKVKHIIFQKATGNFLSLF